MDESLCLNTYIQLLTKAILIHERPWSFIRNEFIAVSLHFIIYWWNCVVSFHNEIYYLLIKLYLLCIEMKIKWFSWNENVQTNVANWFNWICSCAHNNVSLNGYIFLMTITFVFSFHIFVYWSIYTKMPVNTFECVLSHRHVLIILECSFDSLLIRMNRPTGQCIRKSSREN